MTGCGWHGSDRYKRVLIAIGSERCPSCKRRFISRSPMKGGRRQYKKKVKQAKK